MNVLIVGSGIFGLSTALECTGRGMQVTVADSGDIPCSSASSHDAHRLIRYPYGALHGYARLMPSAEHCWERMFDAVGERPYVRTGTLAIGDSSTAWIEHSSASMRELGMEFELMSPAEAHRRYPFLDVKDGKEVLFAPSGGVLLADRILRAAVRLLAERGAALRSGLRVTPENMASIADEVRADAIVVATGAWTELPASLCAYPVTPVRQTVAYIADPPAEFISGGDEGCPMILDLDETSGFYLVPSVAGTPAKIGDHLPGRRDSPDESRAPDHDERSRLERLARSGLDVGQPLDLTFGLCRYAMTPERRFILREAEPPSGLSSIRVLVTGGGSGHGFKFGPFIGRIAADVLEGSLSAEEAHRLASGRAHPGERPYLR